jgi:hypothetical protein
MSQAWRAISKADRQRLATPTSENLIERPLVKESKWRYRPILLKNSKMQSPQFLAKRNRSCELLPRIAASWVRTILVARKTKSRLPPRPKLNEGPERLQSFERLRKRSFSTE